MRNEIPSFNTTTDTGGNKEACKCERQDEEIARLKQKLNKKNDLYLGLDEAMRHADESLSDIRTEKAAIDSILRLPRAS